MAGENPVPPGLLLETFLGSPEKTIHPASVFALVDIPLAAVRRSLEETAFPLRPFISLVRESCAALVEENA
jgi:hypothetical protein